MVGLEPTRVLPRRILNPVRIPISPHLHIMAESVRFELTVPLLRYASLAGKWFKPLTQLSILNY